MKIIEFTGLPGSGKTTICNLLEIELKKKGYKVLNLHVLFSCDAFFQKVKLKIHNMKAKHSTINANFNHFVRAIDLSDNIDVYEWIHIIQIMNYRIHKEAKNYDFILMDEGPLQAITALFHGMDIDNKKGIRDLISSLCSEYQNNVEVIQLDLALDTVCKRLRNRNRDDDSFVDEDEKTMKSLLCQKERNISFVLDASDCNVNHINGDGLESDFIVENILGSIL